MPVRSTMVNLISQIRRMIADPNGPNPQFQDQDILDKLDEHRMDVWYEPLKMAPAIVNAASTNNVPTMIFADYYSDYGFWEEDIVLQGNSTSTHAAWVVLTPVASDYIVGHWQFETSIFTSGTFPGQHPPVFATGKVYDRYAAAADLCEIWSAYLAAAYDITVDGQNLRRSQLMTAKQALAKMFRRSAKPKIMKMTRRDVAPEDDSKNVLGRDDWMLGGMY